MNRTAVVAVRAFWILFALWAIHYAGAENPSAVCRNGVFAFCAVLLGCLLLALVASRKRNASVETVFLVLFLPLSAAIFVSMPVFAVPDEQDHLHTSYLVATGQVFRPQAERRENEGLVAGSGDAPRVTLRETFRRAKLPSAKLSGTSVPVAVPKNVGPYSVFAYVPQALGIAAGRLFTDNRYLLFYCARVLPLALVALMFFFAIRWLPCGKNAALAVSLLPMTLQESASASLDGMTIACSTLLVALVLKAREEESFRMDRKYAAAAGLITAAMVWLKIFYVPLLLLLLLVPDRAFRRGRKGRIAFLAAMAAVAVAAFAAWIAMSILPQIGDEESRVSSFLLPRIAEIASKPFEVVLVFGRTIFRNAEHWTCNFLGVSLSWFSIVLAPHLKMALFAVLPVAALADRPLSPKGAAFVRILFSLLAAGVAASVILMELVWWTPSGSPVISGVQGRYFLPLAVPALLALRKPAETPQDADYPKPWGFYAFLAALACAVVANVLSHKL